MATDNFYSSKMSKTGPDVMFNRVLDAPNVFYKSQQRGDPELTRGEKQEILCKLYRDNCAQFLYRYHDLLNAEDVQNFDHCAEEYEVKFYLAEIRKKFPTQPSTSTANHVKADISERIESAVVRRRHSVGGNEQMKRNRRYAALRTMIKDNNDYFSDWEMRNRDPLLYNEMIGRYLSEEEQRELLHSGKHDGSTLSGMFMDFYDSKLTADLERTQRMEKQMERLLASSHDDDEQSNSDVQSDMDARDASADDDSPFEQEFDSDDEDNCMREEGCRIDKPSQPRRANVSSGDRGAVPVRAAVDSDTRAQLRQEFISIMHERFLSGADAEHFDYSDVDNNTEYDPMDLIERDQQDAYFDSEEPS